MNRIALIAAQACRGAGFEPDVRHVALDFAFQLDLVAADLGVALVPELVGALGG